MISELCVRDHVFTYLDAKVDICSTINYQGRCQDISLLPIRFGNTKASIFFLLKTQFSCARYSDEVPQSAGLGLQDVHSVHENHVNVVVERTLKASR